MVQECEKETKDGNSTISVNSTDVKSINNDSVYAWNQGSEVREYDVEVAVLYWLESVLSSMTKNATLYYQKNTRTLEGAAKSNLQLEFICYWLNALSCQVEALTLQQSTAHTETNCTDSGLYSAQISAATSNLGVLDTEDRRRGTMDLSILRCVCSQVLSKYRGVSLSLLAFDVIRDTGRFRYLCNCFCHAY